MAKFCTFRVLYHVHLGSDKSCLTLPQLERPGQFCQCSTDVVFTGATTAGLYISSADEGMVTGALRNNGKLKEVCWNVGTKGSADILSPKYFFPCAPRVPWKHINLLEKYCVMLWKRRMYENVFKRLWMVESSLANCMQAFLVLGTFDVDSVAQRAPFSNSSDYAIGRELCIQSCTELGF